MKILVNKTSFGIKVLDYFIHSKHLETNDYIVLFRARSLVAALLFTVIVASILSIILKNIPQQIAISISAGICSIASLMIVKFRGEIENAAGILLTSVLLIFTGYLFHQKSAITGTYSWLIILPIASAFYVNFKFALKIGIASILLIIATVVLYATDNFTPPYQMSFKEFSYVNGVDAAFAALLALGLAYLFHFTRRQTESRLLDSEKEALTAVKVKSEFLANMSHEIRTPMNGIIGMTELLLDTCENEDQRGRLEIIRSCGDSLITIINDILDLSKIEAGKLELHSEKFNIRTMFSELHQLLDVRSHMDGTQLVFQIENSLPSLIEADEVRIRQIVTNLIGNALKFAKGGKVELNCGFIKKEGEEITIEISVKDNGIGISQDHQKRLFEAFSQEDSSTTRKYGGTGLGLSICKRLAELHNGSISVDSVLGEGSIFKVWIVAKLAIEKESTHSVASPQSPVQKLNPKMFPLKILIADDNLINASLCQQMLMRLGYSADVASDGIDVLKRCAVANYDLIFLDLFMPEKDGFEVCRELKSSKANNSYIVAFSANRKEDIYKEITEAGFDDFMPKPIKASLLKRILKSITINKAA